MRLEINIDVKQVHGILHTFPFSGHDTVTIAFKLIIFHFPCTCKKRESGKFFKINMNVFLIHLNGSILLMSYRHRTKLSKEMEEITIILKELTGVIIILC